MIRRTEKKTFVLVTQTEHAHLAAKIASEFGNAEFAGPLPRGQTLDAIAQHDAGWPAHDKNPTINPQGQPAHALEMPLATMLPIWSESTNIILQQDPYSGLLVSLHGLALSLSSHPPAGDRPLLFALNKFQHAQVEIQESLRKRMKMRTDLPLHYGLAAPGAAPEEDLLTFNFRLLQMADQLSLNLCFGEARLPTIADLLAQPGEEPISIAFEVTRDGAFRVDPWPFGQDELDFHIAAKTVPARNYSSDGEFRRFFRDAEETQIHVRLRP